MQADPPVLHVLVLLQIEDGALGPQHLRQAIYVPLAPGLRPAEEGGPDFMVVQASLRVIFVGIHALPSHLPGEKQQGLEQGSMGRGDSSQNDVVWWQDCAEMPCRLISGRD